MTFSVTMPALGESVTEGTVTRWLKKEGEHVSVDEPLLEVSTDKVDTEIPSPVAGVLQKIVVQVDATVAVGAELAVIADSAGATSAPVQSAPVTAAPIVEKVTAPVPTAPPAAVVLPAVAQTPVAPAAQAAPASSGSTIVSMPALGAAAPKPAAPVVQAPVTPAPVQSADITPAPSAPAVTPIATTATIQNEDSYVTPIVRKLAAEAGVNLATVKGTGVGGRIRKEDILAAAPRAAAAPSAQTISSAPVFSAPTSTVARASIAVSPLRGTSVTMTRLRKVIADRMVESLKISAQLTTVIEVDVTKIDRLRKAAKESFEAREGVKLTYLPFFAVAVCEALKQHPVLNSIVEGDQITYHGAEHLGIAVDTERGLLVPVVKDAGDLNMGGIARKITDVAARTRDNKITPDELGGGTFTITNTGSRGALFDTPIINQPQVAILGLGAVVKRPMVVKGADGGETIAIRSMVYLALSYDHRVVDGADAARFLVTLKDRLEEGRFESDLGL
ncbi:MAG: 2-oxoglutarate dehydrogenase, E2 component, dihydrolipoamide succinyltransferase [Actinobacteria bacterium]|nr:2-oxoglutarate dehydrogenase, E2 component, dihydrolipoamide succinyltransferase [Actinomycetota bacterium]